MTTRLLQTVIKLAFSFKFWLHFNTEISVNLFDNCFRAGKYFQSLAWRLKKSPKKFQESTESDRLLPHYLY